MHRRRIAQTITKKEDGGQDLNRFSESLSQIRGTLKMQHMERVLRCCCCETSERHSLSGFLVHYHSDTVYSIHKYYLWYSTIVDGMVGDTLSLMTACVLLLTRQDAVD